MGKEGRVMKKLLLLVIVCMASVVLWAGGAWGAGMCVDPGGGGPYTDLQIALTAAQTNAEDDTIKVVQGLHNGNFAYESDQGYSITLRGGYTAGCAGRVVNPANTVLDGGNAGRVLELYNSNGGAIYVAGFTIQNGVSSADGGGVYANSELHTGTAGTVTLATNIVTGNSASDDGGGAFVSSYSFLGTAGNVYLINTIVTGNTAGSSGGGVYASSDSGWDAAGDVTLTNNTISGNTADGPNGGGVFARSYGTYDTATAGTTTLTNNTITDNSVVSLGGGVYAHSWGRGGSDGIVLTNNIIAENEVIGSGDGGGAYVEGNGPSGGDITVTNNTVSGNNIYLSSSSGIFILYGVNTVNCYNNIIWDNTSTMGGETRDIYLSGTGTTYGYNNDYSVMDGSWDYGVGTNIDLDPLFVGGGNYHLQPGSPCIDAGLNTPPGGLPATDFEGDDRIINDTVDIGADEYSGVVVVPTDFDADGVPDILWRNPSTGSNALWYMDSDGTAIKSAAGMPSCGTSWQAGGVADFDDDGVPDILWRNPSTGSNALWYMQSNGTSIKSAAGVPSCGTSWEAGGVADFDADGVPDILWRNPATGSNALWYMDSDGTAIKSAAGMPSCGTSWEVGGVADFDADGTPDILWRNPSTGSNALWYMDTDGTAIKSAAGMPSCGTSWEVGKIADFDADGVPDILWRNPATGSNALWYMQSNGTAIKSAAGMPSCGTSWDIGG